MGQRQLKISELGNSPGLEMVCRSCAFRYFVERAFRQFSHLVLKQFPGQSVTRSKDAFVANLSKAPSKAHSLRVGHPL